MTRRFCSAFGTRRGRQQLRGRGLELARGRFKEGQGKPHPESSTGHLRDVGRSSSWHLGAEHPRQREAGRGALGVWGLRRTAWLGLVEKVWADVQGRTGQPLSLQPRLRPPGPTALAV